MTYTPSERSKSELYVELLPLINSRRVDLLDDRKSIAQLVGLGASDEHVSARTSSIMRPAGMTTGSTRSRARL